ncbi:hypothetical protein EVAR_11533_1 [Eumeta japonica]|uniref:Uncharacterized protein n=1 Tax=Eumeta variegata TaxID=151549 RepID=A0A4C1TYR0_EUMVA|nr:hypothetical protein EVAR_11533_1 [Eumeta japonica]
MAVIVQTSRINELMLAVHSPRATKLKPEDLRSGPTETVIDRFYNTETDKQADRPAILSDMKRVLSCNECFNLA